MKGGRNAKRAIPKSAGPPKDHLTKKIPNVKPANMKLAKSIPHDAGEYTLNQYQIDTKPFIKFPDTFTITYPALGLASEAGEVAGVVAKCIRDRKSLSLAELPTLLLPELGDVLWNLAVLAYNVGLTLEDVAKYNIEKLTDRVNRGVIGGSGDHR
jgi:NTP pyrophosphatase (non-canonical NTP hydrolase)